MRALSSGGKGGGLKFDDGWIRIEDGLGESNRSLRLGRGVLDLDRQSGTEVADPPGKAGEGGEMHYLVLEELLEHNFVNCGRARTLHQGGEEGL